MTTYSNTLANTRRDLMDVLSTMVKASPNFISKFRPAPEAKSTKHEWLEDQIAPLNITVTGVAGLVITAIAADIANLRVGTILTIQDDPALFRVASIDSTTTATVALVATNGSSTTAPAENDVMMIVSTPELEASTSGTSVFHQSGTEYNYTQIFRKDIVVSGTAMAVGTHDGANDLTYQTMNAMQRLTRDLNRQAIYGRRIAPNPGSSVAGEAGGLYAFGTAEGGLSVNASGNKISTVWVNDASALINGEGGNANTILIGVNQARVLSYALQDKVQILQSDPTRGSYVAQVPSDINGRMQTIFADPDMPDTEAWVMDDSGLFLSNLQGRGITDMDSTPKGFDGIKRTAMGELTFVFKNAKQRLCRLYGLKASATALAEIS